MCQVNNQIAKIIPSRVSSSPDLSESQNQSAVNEFYLLIS